MNTAVRNMKTNACRKATKSSMKLMATAATPATSEMPLTAATPRVAAIAPNSMSVAISVWPPTMLAKRRMASAAGLITRPSTSTRKMIGTTNHRPLFCTSSLPPARCSSQPPTPSSRIDCHWMARNAHAARPMLTERLAVAVPPIQMSACLASAPACSPSGAWPPNACRISCMSMSGTMPIRLSVSTKKKVDRRNGSQVFARRAPITGSSICV